MHERFVPRRIRRDCVSDAALLCLFRGEQNFFFCFRFLKVKCVKRGLYFARGMHHTEITGFIKEGNAMSGDPKSE